MRVIVPETVTDQNLIASNVAEDDAPHYDAAATYAVGDEVILNHVIYRAAKDDLTGIDPATDDGTAWVPIGASGRWRPFDGVISDPVTIDGTELRYDFRPQSLTRGVALFGLVADRVIVTVTYGDKSVTLEQDLVSYDRVTDFYAWLFDDVTRDSECVFLDLPWFGLGSEISVRVISDSGGATIGQIVFGAVRYIGQTRWGAEIGLVSSSRKERDDYGRWVIVKRYTSRTARIPVMVRGQTARSVQRLFSDLDAVPAVWVGDERGEFGLINFGFYLTYQTTLVGEGWSEVLIYVESIQ